MFYGARLWALAGFALAMGVVLAPMSAFAQRNAWLSLDIDGSSPNAFEASVAALQNALPARERADFETALAVVWFSGATAAGDLDRDGELETLDRFERAAARPPRIGDDMRAPEEERRSSD